MVVCSSITRSVVHPLCVLLFIVTVPHRPSTLDIIVAAHTLLLLHPPLPDPILKDLIIESYPSLAVHARIVLLQAFPDPTVSPLTYHKPATNTWSALIPTFGSNTPKPEPSEVEKEFTNMRWAWIGLAIVSAIGYLWLNPLIVLEQLPDGEEAENPEEEEESDDEEVLVDTGGKDGDGTEA